MGRQSGGGPAQAGAGLKIYIRPIPGSNSEGVGFRDVLGVNILRIPLMRAYPARTPITTDDPMVMIKVAEIISEFTCPSLSQLLNLIYYSFLQILVDNICNLVVRGAEIYWPAPPPKPVLAPLFRPFPALFPMYRGLTLRNVY